jgi:hypothetical protein
MATARIGKGEGMSFGEICRKVFPNAPWDSSDTMDLAVLDRLQNDVFESLDKGVKDGILEFVEGDTPADCRFTTRDADDALIEIIARQGTLNMEGMGRSVIDEIIEDSATSLEAAKRLGMGLMRGNARTLQLGYTYENAAYAAAEVCGGELSSLDTTALRVYLCGFGHAILGAPRDTDLIARIGTQAMGVFYDQYAEGYRAGMMEERPRLNPAGAYEKFPDKLDGWRADDDDRVRVEISPEIP